MVRFAFSQHLNLRFFSLISLIFFSLGCQEKEEKTLAENLSSEPVSPLFRLMKPEETGIQFQNTLPENDQFNILVYEYYYNGGGVAIGDVNNDGLADIFFSANLVSNRLYLNQGNLKFQEVTQATGIVSRPGWKTGVTMVDINQDGFLDIYICRSGNVPDSMRANELFINLGNGKFSEKASEYGLDDRGYSTHAAFFDYDRDGDLDMYLLNHANNPDFNIGSVSAVKKQRHPLFGDKLYRNDNGKFKDVSAAAGIKGNPAGFGLSVSISDLNDDGWPDIFIANDYIEQDYLYLNNQDGTFTDQLENLLAHTSHFSMGSDIADINNDAKPDLMVLDMLPEDNYGQKILKGPDNYDRYQQQVDFGFYHQQMRNTLQLNMGNGRFSEIGQLAGISNTDWSWSALFADFDNDGKKDLHVTNGYVRASTHLDFIKYVYPQMREEAAKGNRKLVDGEVSKQIPTIQASNYIFKNNGNLTFSDQTKAWGLQRKSYSNGAAYGDLDNDGDLDLVVNNINGPAFIYQNQLESQSSNHYLRIRLIGEAGNNQMAVGAKVMLEAGGTSQYQELQVSRGFQSSVEPILHFGLGNQVEVDKLTIYWPDGERQIIGNIPADKSIRIEKSGTETVPEMAENAPLFVEVKNIPGLNFQHKTSQLVDFKKEPLIPKMASRMGPSLVSGDINGDGRADIVIGGGENQPSYAFIQRAGGGFLSRKMPDNPAVQVNQVLLLDVEGDGDLDVYLASGGNQYDISHERYQDLILINDGSGRFRAGNPLPKETRINSGAVAAADMDGDGDLDLMVGEKVTPGNYPLSQGGILMRNDRGTFTNVTNAWAPELGTVGMVNDAVWKDLNQDQKPDLIIAGEWEPIRIFLNQGDRLTLQKEIPGLEKSHGWWNRILVEDIDGDGDLDLVGGNLGLNSQLRVSEKEPASILMNDFDQNGSLDPIISCYIQGKSYPIATRDELLSQLNFLKKRYQTYDSYARATTADLFSEEELQNASRKYVYTFASSWFENTGNLQFEAHQLPIEAQFAPVNAILFEDFDGDGAKDLLLSGNFFPFRSETGRFDAGTGIFLKGNGRGDFTPLISPKTGFYAAGDVRDMCFLSDYDSAGLVVVGRNDQSLQYFKPGTSK
jgi:hypothetical protein